MLGYTYTGIAHSMGGRVGFVLLYFTCGGRRFGANSVELREDASASKRRNLWYAFFPITGLRPHYSLLPTILGSPEPSFRVRGLVAVSNRKQRLLLN